MLDYKNVEEFKSQCGYEIDGVWYPRVTKIVDIKSKPALYRFYGAMKSYQDAERMKEQSAIEGTLVHDTIEAILTGQEPSIPLLIKPSVDAFLKFLEDNSIEVQTQYVEYRLFHPTHRYAGTLDAIATIHGKTGILDIKTSQAIYRDYNLQTSAYMAAMIDKVPSLQARWILRIDQNQKCLQCGAVLRTKGGNGKIRTQWNNYVMQTCAHEWGPARGLIELKEFPFWENDFEAFLGAKRLWEWEHEEMLKKIGY